MVAPCARGCPGRPWRASGGPWREGSVSSPCLGRPVLLLLLLQLLLLLLLLLLMHLLLLELLLWGWLGLLLRRGRQRLRGNGPHEIP